MFSAKSQCVSPRVMLAHGAALLSIMLCGQAFAQQAASSEDETALEEVVVTGSSIRGVAPVGSALIGINRDTIEAVAPTNVKELLATLPQLGNFGTNAEQSTPSRFRTQGFIPNIHNLGIYATLTLLNGHRVAGTGTEGTFADPSNIPPIAIQRVELIADGASAVYGSDAVAGVVNFIYRKPFDGIEASSTYSFDGDTRYERREVSVIGGKTWDAGGVMAAYAYSDNESPFNTDIPFLALGGDQRSRGGRDLRGFTCTTPFVQAVTPAGAPTGPRIGPAPGFAAAQPCGVLGSTTIIPDGKRHAFLATANHQLTDSLKLWAELNYGEYEARSTVVRPGIAVLVPRTNPFFAANVPASLAAASQVLLSRSGVGLYATPTIKSGGNSQATNFVTGLDLDLSDSWKGVLSLNLSTTKDSNILPDNDVLNILAAVNDTNPATALNPWAQYSGNNPATIAKIDSDSGQRNRGKQRLYELQFKADGPLVALPGGDLLAALGTAFRAEKMDQVQTAGSPNPGAGYNALVRDDHVDRSVSSAFAELNVPLVSDQNELPLVKALTVSLSGRYDYYDKYGGGFNPKYGIQYSPIESVTLRGSYGTNFAAPSLGILGSVFGQPAYNLNLPFTVGYGPFQGTTIGITNAYIISGGNPDLQPEEATTRSFGIDFVPQGLLDGLRVGVTWYKVDYTNLINKSTSPADVITNPAFASLGILFPTPAQIAAAIAAAPPSAPITINSFGFIPATQGLNLGTRIFEGVDIDVGYRLATRALGNWNFGINGNRQLGYDQEVVPGTGFQSRLGTQDAVKWKARGTVGWNAGPVTATSFVNYTGHFRNTGFPAQTHVASFTTIDLAVAYEFKNLLKGVTLQGRAANLFDKGQPFYNDANGYFPALASPFPRSFDVTVRARF